ncbi:glycosyltransferase family 4 protein [Paracoccus sp. SJTW-4]|uniref:glycosyltransferase family 4 protein n=1 Tax=Paracoccus sp. SJTW-4 TaxID=3078428 RepID=UPI0039EA155C
MKLLILSRYDRLGASSRLRTMQYLPWLDAAGIEVTTAAFFDDAYLERLYRGERLGVSAASYYLKRFRQLRLSPPPDLIWLEKEALPWLPAGVEQWLLPRDVPVVSDYDDAVFHRYDLHRKPIIRRLLGHKIDHVMASSALILAGNPYLAARAKAAGSSRVEIVPTVVDIHAYDTTPLPADDGMARIGWIGSPSTWREYLEPMMPMLSHLARENRAKLRVVGADAAPKPELEFMPWTEAEESKMIQGMDIGLMPLDDSPWAQGKCGYKIIQYMACGVPVVASPVGVNSEIVEDGVTGFLASTPDEWRQGIARLLRDPELRRRMGRAGRRRVEERYSLQVWGPRVADLLHSAVRP